ncbi:MAG: hypothetical protein JSV50_04550 [Desulfobacteraceae bacterium]|nr:MAG: hypothetical protein JSV50_04550 [Desulfobacteraceae bacterium]
MELPRKIGIGVVMIVPAFVFGGIVWSLIESWIGVIVIEILMVLLYSSIISGWPVQAFQKI